MSNIVNLSAHRILHHASRFPTPLLRQFCEDLLDLLQFGGDVAHPCYLASITGHSVTVFIGGVCCCVSDEELSRIVRELAESVVREAQA